jgi:protoheme IX farnesyltransferase
MIGMRKPLYRLKEYGRLCKVRVSVFNALAAIGGCLLAPAFTIGNLAVAALGVFLLACGGSALNQYQERDIDALMKRTRTRPLPAGIIRPCHALCFALGVLVLALAILACFGNLRALLLGLFAVLWYNLLYTYLKRKSAFAMIPGALAGAIPPAVGWVAAGGGLFDARLWALCVLFFLWQVPHFWLLMLDRGREYKRAGLPTLYALFKERALRRICFHWIAALAVASLCASLYGLVEGPLIRWALLAAAVWIIREGRGLLAEDGNGAVRLFRMVNAYMFMVVLGVVLDNMFVLYLSSFFT